MSFSSMSLSALVAVLAVMPAVEGHMSMWHPSMYGFNVGYEPVTPLANMGMSQWWFHGYSWDQPRETMTLTPGQSVNIEIACSKEYTSWGGQPTNDACPNDAGAYHAGGSTGSYSGWGGNSDDNLAGCALAIAYKSSAAETRPEDFTVMSIQENCVKQRDTSFDIPSNLPACPEGGCTCAWFWQGRNSAEEMYMIGFKCDVNGGAVGGNIPRAVAPVQGQVSNGPTQPFYWANYEGANVFNIGWDNRPSYNAKWGWSNGAQNAAFGGSGGSPAPTRSSSTSSSRSRPTQSTGEWQQGEQGQGGQGQWQGQGGQGGNGNGNGNPDWNNYAAAPTSAESAAAAPTGNSDNHAPCRKVRRRRRSRTRSVHHAQNAARH